MPSASNRTLRWRGKFWFGYRTSQSCRLCWENAWQVSMNVCAFWACSSCEVKGIGLRISGGSVWWHVLHFYSGLESVHGQLFSICLSPDWPSQSPNVALTVPRQTWQNLPEYGKAVFLQYSGCNKLLRDINKHLLPPAALGPWITPP